jgi:hypothetical protein
VVAQAAASHETVADHDGRRLVLVTGFLASNVWAIEMVTIVLGVGATRGWQATLTGDGRRPPRAGDLRWNQQPLNKHKES